VHTSTLSVCARMHAGYQLHCVRVWTDRLRQDTHHVWACQVRACVMAGQVRDFVAAGQMRGFVVASAMLSQ